MIQVTAQHLLDNIGEYPNVELLVGDVWREIYHIANYTIASGVWSSDEHIHIECDGGTYRHQPMDELTIRTYGDDEDEGEKWDCPVCRHENDDELASCEMCGFDFEGDEDDEDEGGGDIVQYGVNPFFEDVYRLIASLPSNEDGE